jgi:hypothetical protein
VTLPPEDDPVDEALVRGGYLDDGGFTARVLDALPPPRRRAGAPRLVVAASVAGALVGAAALLGPGAPLLAALAAWLGGGVPLAAVPGAALGAAAVVAVTGLLVAFAD